MTGTHDVVAGALVRGGSLLLCHRHPDRRWYPDVWDLPGGHVGTTRSGSREDGPTALRRELLEELGVSAAVQGPPLWSLREEEMQLRVWRVDSWEQEPTVTDPAEHDRIAWVPLDEATHVPLAHPSYVDLLVLLGGGPRGAGGGRVR